MHKNTANLASFKLKAFGFDSQNLGEIPVLLLSQAIGQMPRLSFTTGILEPNSLMKPLGVSSKGHFRILGALQQKKHRNEPHPYWAMNKL